MSAAVRTAARTIAITVPGSPATELAPNRRRHGREKAAATRQHRQDAMFAASAARPDAVFFSGEPMFAGPVAVSLLVRWGKGHRVRDLDTVAICCKPYLDGLTDAKIWNDDAQIKRLIIEQERDETGRGEVVIEVTGIKP